MNNINISKTSGGGVNASQTISLNRKCQDLILKSACLPAVRDNVLVPILEYLAHDAEPKMTVKDDPVQIMWCLFRQGSFMCELLNQVQPGVIPAVTLPVSPIGPTNFNDSNSRQNVAAFIKASRDMFFLTDDQLFNPGDLFKEDFNAFSKAMTLCEMYLNNKIRVSSRSSYILSEQNLDGDIFNLFDASAEKNNTNNKESEFESKQTKSSNSKRHHILEEMIASERVYVEDLAKFNKLNEMLKFEKIFNQKSLDLIFSNLKDLLNFQRKFMLEMESQIQKDRPDFGALFTANEAQFSVYEEFSLNHSVALKTLKENEKILDSRPDLLESFGGGTVEGYLIKPIQRVTRYSLFLRDLIKEARKIGDDLEAKNAEIAAESVKRITNRINERQRAAENEKASQAFFAHFNAKVMNPEKTGKLILYDHAMRIKIDAELKVYQVFMFQKKLIMCGEKEVFGPFWLKNRISINSVKDVKDKNPNSNEELGATFEAEVTCSISDKEVNFSFLFRTQAAQRMWINALRSLSDLPAIDYSVKGEDEEKVAIKLLEDGVKNDIQAPRESLKTTRIRIFFRDEYFSFVYKANTTSATLSLKELCELVRTEICEAYRLEFQNEKSIPESDRLRLRFKDEDGEVVRLSNDGMVEKLLTDRSGGLIDLIVFEGDPIRVRFTYRDCWYTFTVDELSVIEELRMYIFETISEDYRLLNANFEAVPRGDAMRLFFREADDKWSLMLYDNDLEVALKISNRNIDIKL